MNRIILLILSCVAPVYLSAQDQPLFREGKNDIAVYLGISNMAEMCGGLVNKYSPSSDDLFSMYEPQYHDVKHRPLISIEYRHLISSRWQAGINVDYSSSQASLVDPVSSMTVSKTTVHGFSITPSLKYSYVQGSYGRIYSGAGAGAVFLTSKETEEDPNTTAPFVLLLTPVGVDFYLSPVMISVQSFYGRCGNGREYGGVKFGVSFKF